MMTIKTITTTIIIQLLSFSILLHLTLCLLPFTSRNYCLGSGMLPLLGLPAVSCSFLLRFFHEHFFFQHLLHAAVSQAPTCSPLFSFWSDVILSYCSKCPPYTDDDSSFQILNPAHQPRLPQVPDAPVWLSAVCFLLVIPDDSKRNSSSSSKSPSLSLPFYISFVGTFISLVTQARNAEIVLDSIFIRMPHIQSIINRQPILLASVSSSGSSFPF